MDAAARLVLDAGPDRRLVARELLTPAPLGARLADGAVHLVGTAAGPLGGDRLHLHVELLPSVRATVRSVAAALAQRGDGTPSHHHVEVVVGAGAHLDWDLEPLVAAAGCDHHTSAVVHLAADASVDWRDELVLGRSGEVPGRCRSSLRIVRDGEVVVHQETSTALPGWDGPAVTAGAAVVGHRVVVGRPAPGRRVADDSRAAWSRLADDVGLAVAVAGDHASLRRALDDVAPPRPTPPRPTPARPASAGRSGA
ncbi:urease accessory protein UreD [Nitriliruptoraceae bacterium ZYF776]|nr:urease accessory protein UreD [Profundirhabdus halotolerans]